MPTDDLSNKELRGIFHFRTPEGTTLGPFSEQEVRERAILNYFKDDWEIRQEGSKTWHRWMSVKDKFAPTSGGHVNATRTASAPSERRRNNFEKSVLFASFAFSLVALAVALDASFAIWKKITLNYDYSTPANALKSHLLAVAERDYETLLELEMSRALDQLDRSDARESLRALEIVRSETTDEFTVLFYTIPFSGVPKHRTATFEKDASSGEFYIVGYNAYSVRDEDVREQIRRWQETGSFAGQDTRNE